MAIYFGGKKCALILGSDGTFCINIDFPTPTITGIMLKSLDNYILKDSQGLYLTVKEDE